MLHPERRRESIRQIAYEEGFHDGYAQALSEMPQIVRCKECNYGQKCVDARKIQCFKWNSGEFGILHEPDWCCADGKRKEGNGDG